jgi:putative transcriptional regulator
LLVATPELTDPSFARTVVLILDHGRDAAFGIVLNRPTDRVVGDAVAPWAEVASAPGVVFVGGPVGVDQVVGIGLGVDQPAAPGWAPLFDDLVFDDLGPDETGPGEPRPGVPRHAGLGSVDLDAGPGAVSLQHLRVFVGYAGWGVGQLEGEIKEGSWFVVDADVTSDVFGSRPERLWPDVLRRQPGRTAWFANCPEDRSTN